MFASGLLRMPSEFDAKTTMDRLLAEVEGRGMTVFARIDHAAGAMAAGMALPPTELILFGSPKAGTPLMQSEQAIGIDLPLKALVYQEASGEVWLAYVDPNWLARRYELGPGAASSVAAMAKLLEAVATKATKSA